MNEDEHQQPIVPLHINFASILLICFIAEHNLPFMIADHLIDLCKVIFLDSAIAQGLYMKRTKCTELTKKLSISMTDVLIEKLRRNLFSVGLDESTDVSTTKCLTVIVKYFDKDEFSIKTNMLNLLNLYDGNAENVGSTVNSLFQMLKKTLQNVNIPLENFVGFAADGASNIMGGGGG